MIPAVQRVTAHAGAKAKIRVERIVGVPAASTSALDLVGVATAGSLGFHARGEVHEVVDLGVRGGGDGVCDVGRFGIETAALVRVQDHAVAGHGRERVEEEKKEEEEE